MCGLLNQIYSQSSVENVNLTNLFKEKLQKVTTTILINTHYQIIIHYFSLFYTRHYYYYFYTILYFNIIKLPLFHKCIHEKIPVKKRRSTYKIIYLISSYLTYLFNVVGGESYRSVSM